MQKILKILFFLPLVLIIILTAVLGFAYLTFDDDDYRKGLVSLVNNLSDYQIEIEEPFKLQFSRRPALTAAGVKLKLPGEPEALRFRDIDIVLTPAALLRGELELEVAGLVDDRATLEWLLPQELYILNRVKLSGQVTATGARLRINDFKARGSNPQGLDVEVAGGGLIEDFSAMQPFSQLDLLIKIVSPDSRSLKGYLPDDLPELGPTRGSLRLVGVSPEALGVEDIALDFGSDDRFSLRAEGRIGKIPLAPGTINSAIELKLKGLASRTEDLNKLLDISLPETGIIMCSGRLQGTSNELLFKKFKLNFGKNALEANFTGSFAADRPKFSGQVKAQKLYLDDFPLKSSTLPEAESKAPLEPGAATAKPAKKNFNQEPLFSRQPFSLEALRKFDCDVDIDISVEQVLGFKDVLKDFEIGLKIHGDRLNIDPVSFVFEGGYVKASLLMDELAAGHEVALKGALDDLDLVETLSMFGVDSVVTGKLTITVDLHSHGLSPYELATNLSGNLDMALEGGQVPSHTLNLIATDMLGWSFRRMLMKKKYADINCGILSLMAESGVLGCRAFILESPNLRITGAGSVDLIDETCDLVLYPKKKKNFLAIVTPVTIKGDLQAPKVRAIPARKAALLYGGSLVVPQLFLPAVGANYLWEMVTKDKGGVQSPCFEYLHQPQQQQSEPPPQQ
ncbi:MAG: AsmA family protein [Pseudomonadota bacterium]|nr:AsmA family protein [Pseudomonadota bacterium]